LLDAFSCRPVMGLMQRRYPRMAGVGSLTPVPKRIGLKSHIRHSAGAGKIALDYVTRRFNASSAGLKKAVGPDLRWDTA
jgi:hypothetical protein